MVLRTGQGMRLCVAMATALLTGGVATAELQNVTVDGSIQIRANWYHGLEAFNQPTFQPGTRWPAGFLPGRPIGTQGGPLEGAFGWDRSEPNLDYIEMRTRLGFAADFTNEVSAYIEFDSYDIWGDDIRQPGFYDGARSPGNANISLYQAYIQADEMWGYPLRLRVGRQEIVLGSEFLVGNSDAISGFYGLAFDAVRLDYTTDLFSVTAFSSILQEEFDRNLNPVPTRTIRNDQRGIGGRVEEDATVTFHGIYGSYLGIEDITLDAYWLWLRDPRSVSDTELNFWGEWWESVFRLDQYNVTNIQTVGLRAAGVFGGFDFDVEGAYQWGKVHQVGFDFAPFGVYGDDSLKQSEWAFTATLGYTFDMQYSPRAWAGFHYFSGSDNRDISFLQWLNPWDRPRGSTAFNRLFSDHVHTEFAVDQDFSNVWIVNGGVEVQLTESVSTELYLAHFRANDAFAAPVSFNLGRYRIPVAPALSFWTTDNSKDLGTEVALYVYYDYSEDLSFEAGVAHLFTGRGLTDGQFVTEYGRGFSGGSANDNPTFVYGQVMVSF